MVFCFLLKFKHWVDKSSCDFNAVVTDRKRLVERMFRGVCYMIRKVLL